MFKDIYYYFNSLLKILVGGTFFLQRPDSAKSLIYEYVFLTYSFSYTRLTRYIKTLTRDIVSRRYRKNIP